MIDAQRFATEYANFAEDLVITESGEDYANPPAGLRAQAASWGRVAYAIAFTAATEHPDMPDHLLTEQVEQLIGTITLLEMP